MHYSECSFILKPSALGGVGVFAVHDIPANSLVLDQPFELRVMKTKDIKSEWVKYCIYINDEEMVAPERFDRMEIGWYINHSDEPNIARKTPLHNTRASNKAEIIANMKVRSIYAIKDIKSGDEILIDYNSLDEPEHLKEHYYKQQ